MYLANEKLELKIINNKFFCRNIQKNILQSDPLSDFFNADGSSKAHTKFIC